MKPDQVAEETELKSPWLQSFFLHFSHQWFLSTGLSFTWHQNQKRFQRMEPKILWI